MFECIKENRKCNERTVKSIALFLVLSSYFITAIDGSIVITGLKRIAEDLQLSSVSLSWVQNAYVLVFGGFMLLGGRLGDTLGRKRMFNLSLMLFGFGSLGAGVAPSAGIMIAARFVQGVGAAVMAPAALALIMDYLEGEKRTKAVAWYGSISGIGLCFGLIIGGAVTTYLTWRDGFLINVPIVGVMLFLSVKYLLNADLTKHRFDHNRHTTVGGWRVLRNLCHRRSISCSFMARVGHCTSYPVGTCRTKSPYAHHAFVLVPQPYKKERIRGKGVAHRRLDGV